MLMRAIFWKEWRQQSPILMAILVFLPILMGLLGWLGGSFADDRFLTSDKLGMAALAVAILQAMVTGSLLFAGEVEGGTLDFLDACSAERSRIWLAKMASALVIALPALLLPALVRGLSGLLWTGFAIETLLLAAVCSVFVRTTFRAIGAAAFCLFVLSCVVAQLSPFSALGAIGLNFVLVGIAVVAAWLRFCRPDRQRHADAARSLLLRLPATWLTGSLWFLVRRQWRTLLSVGIALVGFLVWSRYSRFGVYSAFAIMPAFQFAVGCVLGWSVFALEQAGAERFLGDQRLPRNRLWLAKVGGWLATTVVAIGVVAVPDAVRLLEGRHPYWAAMAASGIGRELALGLLGFSAGQLFGIHDRRLPVTAVLTLLAVTPLAAAWYAPLFGGEPAWHFAVVPILFLAATRFELRGWTAGRLDGTLHWLRCGLVVLVGFAWTGLVLWHRTAEVPDVGAPFVARESPIETPIERQRNKRLAWPAEQARRRVRKLSISRDEGSVSSQAPFSRWHEPGIELGPDPSIALPSLFAQVVALGAPDEGRDEFARLMTEAFEGEWSTELRQNLVDDRRVPIRRTPETDKVALLLDDAARLFYLKSALLLAEGKADAALDEFSMSLAIVRYRYRFGGLHLGIYLEEEMLDAADTMLRRGGSDPKLCRGLLALLNRHAQEMPSFSELIEASYENVNPRPAQWIASRDRSLGPVANLIDAPLETIRRDRLERAFCRGLLKAAEEKTLFLRPRTLDDYRRWDPLWPARYLALATPDSTAEDWGRILSHPSLLFGDLPLFELFEREFHSQARLVARLDALRLACAAALFRHDHGRDLESLAELTPEYFAKLPESPYAECAFVYRRSPGETWKLGHGGEETLIGRTIAPGTGVIEMPCPQALKVAVPAIR